MTDIEWKTFELVVDIARAVKKIETHVTPKDEFNAVDRLHNRLLEAQQLEQEFEQLIRFEDTPIMIDDLVITHINGAYRIYTDTDENGQRGYWHPREGDDGYTGTDYPTLLDALKKAREICNG